MQDNYVVAGKGLQIMFWGTIASLVGALVPVIGAFIALAGALVVLYGLYTAMGAHENYKLAMYMAIAAAVLSVLGFFFSDGILAVVLNVVSSVVGFLEVYYICTATAAVLSAKGDEVQAGKANLIITLNLICTAVVIVCSLVVWIPVVAVIAGVVAGLAGIVGLVAFVLQLIFYYKSSKSLLA